MKLPLILVFLKFPAPGKVKTRLANAVGPETAAAIYRRLVRDVVKVVCQTRADVRFLYDPPDQHAEVHAWLEELWPEGQQNYGLAAQAPGDLGARLEAGFKRAFQEGYEKVAAIGTDCVEIDPHTFVDAWQRLDEADAVFGPTRDGGYYLIGLRQLDRRIFNVTWSSESTLTESLERCEECRFKTSLMDPKNDIDDNQDWAARKLQILEEATLGHQPLIFTPLYMERVWGGRTLEERFGRPLPNGNPFGEAWELVDRPEAQSVIRTGPLEGITLGDLWQHKRNEVFGTGQTGDHFPLLLKILDARDDLSLQVHPPASVAGELQGEPKTEMWYVAHAEPDAKLYVGLKPNVDANQFQHAIEDGMAADLVHEIPVKTGEFIFIPSGRLHAIGGGLLIYEIQQNSDTTYRVYDWNRVGLDGKPRELHLQQAMRSIDFKDVEPKLDQPTGDTLVACDKFVVKRWTLQPNEKREAGGNGTFACITVVEGQIRCGDYTFKPGDFFVIPACAGQELALDPGDQPAMILRTTLPLPGTVGSLRLSDSAQEGFYQNIRKRIVNWAQSEMGQNHRAVDLLLLAPDMFHLTCKLAADSRVPIRYKAELIGVIAYFFSPFDFMPEAFFGPLGFLDDLMLAAYVLNRLANEIDPAIIRGHWAGRQDALELAQTLLKQADELLGSGLWKRLRDSGIGQ